VTYKEEMEGSDIKKNKLCVSFTYAGRETKFIKKIFQNTNDSIAYRTTNNI